ncbi:MAG: nitroreductase, partial [Clostridia bacterium]|nr:nitroreductase [Clostridia bacterium]
MSKSVFEIIKSRRSVRTFDGKGLGAAERGEIEKMLAQGENPFGVEVKMLLLDKKEHGLSSPVVIGEDAYISAKVRR